MDFSSIIDWANANQGVVAIIIFLAGGISWFFSKDKIPSIKAGGDITAGGDISVGNKTFNQRSGKSSENIQGENITVNKYNGNK